MSVVKEQFGEMPDGRRISLYTITNKNGSSAAVTDLGAVWVRMIVPDAAGKYADVLLGYRDAKGYLENGPHFGSIVGRIANRTGRSRYFLKGREYQLSANDGRNNLHSGPDYYDRRLWEVKETGDDHVVFSLHSPDGDQGYPGNMELSVEYRLTEDDTFEITYHVLSDQDTPVNITNHAYLNLGGESSGSILNHRLQIAADMFTPSDAESIPTGEILSVTGTPMDFTKPKRIGQDIDSDYPQLVQGRGYDHNWCLRHTPGVYSLAASVWDDKSGRCMDVYTDLPGMQFYTANWLDGDEGKSIYSSRDAYCFETQMYPDAVNKPQFASPIIPAGRPYITRTGYHFYTASLQEENRK